MCILIAKAKNARKMSEKEIKTSAEKNPDGCGMAWAYKGKVYTYKSLNVGDVIALNDRLTDDTPIIYHFRIATNGGVKLSNCHPFYDEKLNVAFAHNGVLPIATNSKQDWTDSETAFRWLFVPILNRYKIDSNEFNSAVNTIIGGSKFAFLQGDGTITTFGEFINDDGLLFSNSSYKACDSLFYGDYDPYEYEYAWQFNAIYNDVEQYIVDCMPILKSDDGIDKCQVDWLREQVITDLLPIYDTLTARDIANVFCDICEIYGIDSSNSLESENNTLNTSRLV